MTRPLNAIWLGTQTYDAAYRVQCQLLALRKQGLIEDTVLMLEHPPTITLGKGAHISNLLVSHEALKNLGVALHKADRGGDITMHAPGQLIAYPIIDLAPSQKDVRRYVNILTQTMQHIAGQYGIACGTIDGMIGLWTDLNATGTWHAGTVPPRPGKLGAIGVRISKWVTMHGFALNLTTNLEHFRLIVPCGISEYSVTSVKTITGQAPSCEAEARQAHRKLAELLGRKLGSFTQLSSAEALSKLLLSALAELTPGSGSAA